MVISGTRSSLANRFRPGVRSLTPPAVWKLDVGALGYSAPTARLDPNTVGYGVPPIGPLCFLTNARLAVSFVGRSVTGSLPRRGELIPALPLRLHAVFVRAASGRLETVRQWPVESYRSRIAPAIGGRFVVIDRTRVMLYSADLRLLRTLDVPLGLSATKGSSMPAISPGGHYLLLQYDLNIMRWRELIDTESLRVLRTSTLVGWHLADPESVADNGTMLTANETGSVVITRLGARNQRVVCRSFYNPSCRYGYFIGDSALFRTQRSGRRWSMDVMLVDGQLASDAAAIERAKGGSGFFDIAPHYSLYRILIYQIPSGRWAYALDAKKEGIKSISGLALSPDGSRLALINQDNILEIFRLPSSREQGVHLIPSSTDRAGQ